MDYNKSYFGRLLIMISQAFNALSGGNPDISISARIGYYAHNRKPFYMRLEKIIDFTFYPLEGKGHCYYAWQHDQHERYEVAEGVLLSTILVSLFIILGCFVLSIPFYTYGFIKTLF